GCASVLENHRTCFTAHSVFTYTTGPPFVSKQQDRRLSTNNRAAGCQQLDCRLSTVGPPVVNSRIAGCQQQDRRLST
ncbi:hypothetical protein LSAT2_006246, partial [Lamellibrachia satsuma]